MKVSTNGGGNLKNIIKFTFFPFLMGFFLSLQSCTIFAPSNPLIGPTSFEKWRNSQYWDEGAYFNYDALGTEVFTFQKFFKEDKFKLVIFGSIYCDECLKNIPILVKVTEAVRFPQDKILFYGLDEYSTEPTKFYKKFDVGITPAVFLEFDDGQTYRVERGLDWLKSINQVLLSRFAQIQKEEHRKENEQRD
ncbi:MAG: hypothetical protein A2X64_06300 [Ignavibacteria bacterium GWF2_33_9]|nr:MAG: hypothetical protein A2X64_06300 [Ignavibacteria bacterium GWF2_33_9]